MSQPQCRSSYTVVSNGILNSRRRNDGARMPTTDARRNYVRRCPLSAAAGCRRRCKLAASVGDVTLTKSGAHRRRRRINIRCASDSWVRSSVYAYVIQGCCCCVRRVVAEVSDVDTTAALHVDMQSTSSPPV